MKNKTLKIFLFAIVLLNQFQDKVFAQSKAVESGGLNMETYNTVLIIFVIVLFNLVFISLVFFSDTVSAEVSLEKKRSILKILKDKLSGAKPIEEEGSILLEDNFDGIGELDNKVPPWFNILFYGTIVIAFIYMMDYHVLKTGKLPFEEYRDEMYAADMQRQEMIRTGAFINENNVVLLADPESVNAGKQVFAANCIPCHGYNGEGTVGPNLTDPYWIHGGGIKNVFKTVKYGVPVKGMISWQNQFNPKMIQQVVSYVLSLQGTSPPYGKIPEGEKYIEVDSAEINTDSLKNLNNKNDSVKSVSDTIKK